MWVITEEPPPPTCADFEAGRDVQGEVRPVSRREQDDTSMHTYTR